jgi:ketosteroid isomerase-like protein
MQFQIVPTAAFALLLIGACAAPAPSPDEVVAAERAFAADEAPLGFKQSFLKHSADDAIVLAPDPVNAHQSLRAQPDDDLAEPRPHLVWWPLYAGIASSGDLGFTTGPYAFDGARRGHYFTVWKRQMNGGWKWVFDGGVGADASGEAAQGSDVAYLPTSREKSASPEAAMAAVAALEDALADAASRDLQSAYGAYLDPDSRLHSAEPPPSKSEGDRGKAFAVRPETASLSRLGAGVSGAGDLVWTYGSAQWTEGSEAKKGYYVRVWQKRKAGWRIVFDQLIPPPPPRPAQ